MLQAVLTSSVTDSSRLHTATLTNTARFHEAETALERLLLAIQGAAFSDPPHALCGRFLLSGETVQGGQSVVAFARDKVFGMQQYAIKCELLDQLARKPALSGIQCVRFRVYSVGECPTPLCSDSLLMHNRRLVPNLPMCSGLVPGCHGWVALLTLRLRFELGAPTQILFGAPRFQNRDLALQAADIPRMPSAPGIRK